MAKFVQIPAGYVHNVHEHFHCRITWKDKSNEKLGEAYVYPCYPSGSRASSRRPVRLLILDHVKNLLFVGTSFIDDLVESTTRTLGASHVCSEVRQGDGVVVMTNSTAPAKQQRQPLPEPCAGYAVAKTVSHLCTTPAPIFIVDDNDDESEGHAARM